jgi:hypothetical protein
MKTQKVSTLRTILALASMVVAGWFIGISEKLDKATTDEILVKLSNHIQNVKVKK